MAWNPNTGYLCLILHAHLPYVRHPEYAFALEEHWLYEAITECYVPLLEMLERLVEDRVDFRLTLSMTPTLISMLRDPLLQSRYLERLETLIDLAKKEMKRTQKDVGFHDLASMYHARFLKAREVFAKRYHKDLVAGFKRFMDLGKLEILPSAATHAYLPLFSLVPSTVKAQVDLGIRYFEEAFAREPGGFWLPECGYYPGIEEILKDAGIGFTVLETHGITRADPRPKYSVYAPICCPCGTAFLGRDPETSRQVWSSVEGYPGDFDYREFYRDIAYDLAPEYIGPYIHPDGIRLDTGIKYFRITGKGKDKEIYDPLRAEKKAAIHAGNFMFNRERQIEHLVSIMDRKPLIVAPYDAELFGHWWYEGPGWLECLMRKIQEGQEIFRLVTPTEYLEEYQIHQVCWPSMSSWGYGGYSEVWLNDSNQWIYPRLHSASLTMEALADRKPASKMEERALNQAARELLLAQASDWPFMITNGNGQYAEARLEIHLRRFEDLAKEIETGRIDKDGLVQMEAEDNIFPAVDYRAFAPSRKQMD
jgi:1,4-alpha-glucan branching enzyme